jgi:hypothetical protein
MKYQTVRLVALGRDGSRQSYGTRRLVAGEEFEERRDVADILIRTGRAALAPEPCGPATTAIAPSAADVAPYSPIDSLRAEAERLGIVVDGRWGVARLQHEISQARRR